MYHVHVAEPNEIKKNKDVWNELALVANRPTPFSTHEWFSTWSKYFGAHYSPQVLFVTKQGRIEGILPLAIRTMHIEDSFSYARVAMYASSHELHPDHIDVIARPDSALACARAALLFLQATTGGWDILHLSHMTEESALFQAVLDVGNKELFSVSDACYIPIRDQFAHDFEAWNASLHGERRRKLKQAVRRNQEAGITYEQIPRADIPAALNELLLFHGIRADEKNLKTKFSGQTMLDFHTALAQAFGEEGWLSARRLRSQRETVALIYGFEYAGRHFAYQMGINPDWIKKGPGMSLIYELIRESFEKGLIEFDFLRGGEQYKHTFTEKARTLYEARLYRSSVTGVGCRGLRAVRQTPKHILRKAA